MKVTKKATWTAAYSALLIVAFLALLGCVWMQQQGILRGEIVARPPSPNWLASPGIYVCMALLVLFFLLSSVAFSMTRSGQVHRVKLVLRLCGGALAALLVFTALSLYAHAQTYLFSERKPYFESITLEELDGLSARENVTCMVYILEDDCAACEQLTPVLVEYLDETHQSMLCYNTSPDRDKDYEGMLAILEKYGVSSVPSVVVMDWGRVVEVLHYDDVMNGALPSAQP